MADSEASQTRSGRPRGSTGGVNPAKKRKREGKATSNPSTPHTRTASGTFETPDRPITGTEQVSPARVTRLEEKHELQDLNKRLELYILRQRERDASQGTLQRELDALRDSFDVEKKNLKSHYETQIKALRKTREEQAAACAALQEDKSRQDSLIKQLRQQLASAEKRSSDAESKSDALQRDLNLARNKLFAAEEDLKSSGQELDQERSRAEHLKQDLDRERARADQATAQCSTALSRCKSLEEDYEMMQSKLMEENASLNEQLAEASKTREAVEDDLRREFAAQLKEILQERQRQYEDEKDAGLAELKSIYDAKLKQYRDDLEDTIQELDALKSENLDLQSQTARIKATYSDAIALRESLEKQIATLQAEAEQMRASHVVELNRKQDIIASIRGALKRKEEEFDSLLDVKVALDMEIKQYRTLLEQEEDRLGITPRRRDYDRKISENYVAHSHMDNLMISRMDIGGRCVSIRNGASDPISLRGWTLRTREKAFEFRLPVNITMHPGNTVTVWFGKDSAGKQNGKTDLAWPVDDLWNMAGDELQLVDPTRQTIAKVDVNPLAAGPVSP